MTSITGPRVQHNAGCEQAMHTNCKCHCRGTGHQVDLLRRAAKCDGTPGLALLEGDLERVFGGFHTSVQDISTPTRRATKAPKPSKLARLDTEVGRDATWLETLLVDEALHAAFIEVARSSMGSSGPTRNARERYVEHITYEAINVVGSHVSFYGVVESHVWCSLVAETLASAITPSPSNPPPAGFDAIGYPRRSTPGRPSTLTAVRAAGLQYIHSALTRPDALSTAMRLELLQLVGAATCSDPWQHAAVVRYCLDPFVQARAWPPQRSTTLAVPTNFVELRRRWQRKHRW